LLKKYAKLTRKVEDAETAKTEAERLADEYKNNPTIPKGKQLVDAAEAEFLTVLKEDGVTKESYPTLKTNAEKAITLETEILNDKIYSKTGKEKQAWLDHVRANSLKFETRKNGDDEQTIVLAKDAEGKDFEMKLEDYVPAKAAHVKDAESSDGTPFPRQRIATGDAPAFNPVDKQLAKYSPPPSAAIKTN
jgi:hypothetical protein